MYRQVVIDSDSVWFEMYRQVKIIQNKSLFSYAPALRQGDFNLGLSAYLFAHNNNNNNNNNYNRLVGLFGYKFIMVFLLLHVSKKLCM